MKFLSIAALAVVGAVIIGCARDNSFLDDASQQTASTDHVVTLTTTVGFDEGEADVAPNTRALTADGKKTFANDDRIAVVYTNTSDVIVKAVSEALTSSDITNLGKSATFTVTLTNPKPNGSVKYIYPAAMAKDDGSENYDALAIQNGVLYSLYTKLDLATYEGTLTETAGLPASTTLTNQLAILALKLKNIDGTSDLTSSINSLILNDGTYSYRFNRSTDTNPIYLAIRPTSNADILVTATANPGFYVKTLTNKTYQASNGYPLSWRMSESDAFSVALDKLVYFAPGNLQLVGENTWQFAPNQWEYFGISQSDNHRDLFGWGSVNNPNNVSQNYQDYSWNEWGENTHVQAGIGTGWRTLSKDEWNYVLSSRPTGSRVFGTDNARFAKAIIRTDVGGGVHGLILFPNGVTIANSEVTTAGVVNNANGWGTECTSAQWTALATKGCVFLPAAGCRYGDQVQVNGTGDLEFNGRYWSSTEDTSSGEGHVFTLLFHNTTVYMHNYYRYRGDAVRLVRSAE